MVFSNPAEILTKSLLNTHLEYYYYPKLLSKLDHVQSESMAVVLIKEPFILCKYRHKFLLIMFVYYSGVLILGTSVSSVPLVVYLLGIT